MSTAALTRILVLSTLALGILAGSAFSGGSDGYRSAVLADSPAGYWRLGESSGSTAADEVGTNPGAYVGGVVLGQAGAIANAPDTAASFDGINDHVAVPDANALAATTGVTVETWVKRVRSGAFQVLVGKPGNGQSKFENYALWLNTGNQAVAYFGNGSSSVTVLTPAIDSNWHHVAATYDNAVAKIYLDGTLRASTASTIQLTPNKFPLNIGRARTNSYYFQGVLDEVAVYPTALSAAAINAHYESSFTDTTAPIVTLASPAAGASTNDQTPTFAGLAGTATGDQANVLVNLYAGSSAIGTPIQTLAATRQPNGAYTVDAQSALGEGTFTAQTEQLDASGNVGRSNASTFQVDTTAPQPTLTQPAPGSSGADPTPTFAGLAATGAGDLTTVTVKVYVGSAVAGTPVQTLAATRQGDGSYSVDGAALDPGTYTAQAHQGDVAGNTGSSTPSTFTVLDAIAPVVSLTSPAAGSSLSDATPSFAGLAGRAAGDLDLISVNVWAGSSTSGQPVQSMTALRQPDGSYSADAVALLVDGAYVARAQQLDSAGNTGYSAEIAFTVDTAAPTPTLTSPADGSSTVDATPSFAGVAGSAAGDAASVSIRIYSGSVATGSPIQTLAATRAGDGSYVIDSAPLAEGVYTAVAAQSDAAANTGTSSPTTFTIADGTAPVVTLASPADGSASNDTTPTIAGTAGMASGDEASVAVAVYAGTAATGDPIQTLISPRQGDGTYSIEPTPLAEGTYTARARQSDAASNIGLSSANTFRIDTTAPAPTLTAPVNGSSTLDATPSFGGTAGSGAGDSPSVLVRIYAGASATGTPVQTLSATRQPNNSFAIESGTLTPGSYTAQAAQGDDAGNVGLSAASTFTVNAPLASYAAEVNTDAPRAYWRLGESSGTVAADETAANPGSYRNGVLLGQPGAILTDGNTSAALDGVNDHVFVVDANSLDATTAVSVEVWLKRSKSSAYQVILGKPGNGQSKFENYALWLNSSNQIVAYFGNGTTHVSAATAAVDTNWHHVVATYDNATARIYLDGALKASVASSVQLTPNALPLNIGRANDNAYFFGGRIDEVAIYGTALSASRVRSHFETASGVDAVAPTISLTTPAGSSATGDTTPTFSGTAGTAPLDSSTVTVNVYTGSSATGTPAQTLSTTRDAGGSYSVDATTALPVGTYTAQAEQVDTAGNVGRSSANTFTVDTVAPVVTLTTPAAGAVTGRTPTLAGNAGTQAGDSTSVTVRIYSGTSATGTPVQTLSATRQPSGGYSILSPSLAAGTYTAQSSQSDAVGNVGTSNANTFSVTDVDTSPPAVTITSPVQGSTSADPSPTFSGASGVESGDLGTITVRVYLGLAATGTPVETLTTAASGGLWSVVASPSLSDGTYTVQAEQADDAGNIGRSSEINFAVGASYRDEVLADQPAAYWRLGETGGTTAADELNASPGTYAGTPGFDKPGALSGDANPSIEFDGTSTSISVADSPSLDATTAVTVEAWVKRRTSSAFQVIVGKAGDGQSSRENYALWLNDGNFVAAYFGNGSSYASVFSTAPLDTAWHYLVATYDNSVARLYVDGLLNASASSSVRLTANSLPLNIGRTNDGNFRFGGHLDEIAVYRTALSAARISRHYNVAKSLDPTTPPVTLTTPVTGSSTVDPTPVFAGMAGVTATDSATVTVKLWAGPNATGSPTQTLTSSREPSGSWTTQASAALALGTYTAVAEQADSSGNVGSTPATTFSVVARPAAGADPQLIGAGDIAHCESSGDEATAAILASFPSAIVFTLGDNVYESGTAAEFTNCYAPSWGAAKARTRPALGDHDFADGADPTAAGYFGYFQNQLAPFGPTASDNTKGYYAYDVGTWRGIVLNAICGTYAALCDYNGQIAWLEAELAARPTSCTFAIMSAPRWSSGDIHGPNTSMARYIEILHAAGVEFVMSGDDHIYERFAPQNPSGSYDALGIRQFVVGTGGRSLYGYRAIQPNSEVRNNDAYGVMLLNLRPGMYEWEFIPQAGKSFVDSGSETCH